MGFGDRSTGRGTFGANLGRAIVTNGDFTAYVPSSQITLGKLVHCACEELDISVLRVKNLPLSTFSATRISYRRTKLSNFMT